MATRIRPTARLPVAAGLVLPLVMMMSPHANAQEDDAAEETAVIDGLMWTVRGNGEDVPWEPAEEYCETLELAGYSDWRLPTLPEAESVYDPSAEDNGFIMSPLVLAGCCLWTSTSLADLSAEESGVRGGQRDAPENYYWGFLYSGGIRYYSIHYFPDGQAQCVRGASE
jgi:hypothetical protein